jgi:thiol:disulfide interchange protein DsbD
MLTYSATMAAPFLLFGIFPSLVKSAPKSGGWLHTVKVTGGFLEIGLAIAYIWKSDYTWEWGFFDRNVVLSIWIGLCLITALYLAGVFRYQGDSPTEGIGFGRLMAALLFAMMGAFLISGYSGGNLRVFNTVLPPAPLKVIDNYEDAENLARKERKPIFLEFTGIT